MSKLLAVKDLRPILQAMYPDVEDGREDNENYEHPLTAVGLVLMSAAIIGTTEAAKLTLFTGYSRSFISAITLNMRSNHFMDRQHIRCINVAVFGRNYRCRHLVDSHRNCLRKRVRSGGVSSSLFRPLHGLLG